MSKLGKEGQNVHFGKVKSQKDKIVNRTCLLQMLKEQKHGKEQGIYSGLPFGRFLERERALLSKISRDPTIDSLQDKKESCSTRRGLRVGTVFKEFRKTS